MAFSVNAAQPAVDLGTAGNFIILTKSGISTTGTTSIIGDIGASPIDSTAITGFGLIMDSSNIFSTSSIEALAFRLPNIIIDIGGGYTENIQEIIDQNSSFIVKTADHYLQILDIIFSDYDKFSKNAAKKSIQYYQPDAMTNFREFMKIIQKDRKNLSGSENKRYVK